MNFAKMVPAVLRMLLVLTLALVIAREWETGPQLLLAGTSLGVLVLWEERRRGRGSPLQERLVRADDLAGRSALLVGAVQDLVEFYENIASETGRCQEHTKDACTFARESSEQIHRAVESTERVNVTIDSTNDAVAKIEASVKEVAVNASQASMVAGQAENIARGTREKMADLQETSNQISSFVGVIKDIASKTNLLALNATIEAVRAGEHGRSFVVVANEVKELSTQTAAATADIVRLLGDLSAAIDSSAAAAEQISQITTMVTMVCAQIKETVEQQSLDTGGIGQCVHAIMSSATEVVEALKLCGQLTDRINERMMAAEYLSSASHKVASEAVAESHDRVALADQLSRETLGVDLTSLRSDSKIRAGERRLHDSQVPTDALTGARVD